jgi:cellulose synthase (UDP-forming)
MAKAKSISDPHLWQYRESRGISRRYRMMVAILTIAGLLSIINFGEWWFRESHVTIWPLYIILSFIFWWGIIRMILIWLTYLNIRKPETPEPEPDLRVAIFTTSSPGEPLSMFEKTLEACSKISYPHTTYLLAFAPSPITMPRRGRARRSRRNPRHDRED